MLALGVYAVMVVFVGWRAVKEPAVRRNVPPDHWILMGATGIATLAGVHVHGALDAGPIADAVRAATIVTWVVASVQIVPLAIVGWRRICDWPAVFPLGMYSAATFAFVAETGWSALRVVSLVFFWIALAACCSPPSRFRPDPVALLRLAGSVLVAAHGQSQVPD